MANAALALTFSDEIEGMLMMRPTEEEERRLREGMPRVVVSEERKGGGALVGVGERR